MSRVVRKENLNIELGYAKKISGNLNFVILDRYSYRASNIKS